MKVGNIGLNPSINIESKNNKSKLDFSDSFNQTSKSKTKEELELYIKEIKNTGNRLAVTQNYTDVVKYKKVIKSYLKSIVDYVYELNKKDSFWDANYFTTVNTVNEKLEEITKELLYDQKSNIDVASKVDEINGLLIDIYM
ncbi:YaaR family protein [Clostridium sp. CCUG 7971]|uniref:YaaR family protein n=1 Tax=Clostridium sp. CCUG 7971 TaxID=2811414 RepID=UPI001ABB2C2B|nr:YaaR family protein [Clostridium sp. CCUG 7971]MBO3446325.1 YaaR family protein [Clostridium sp. CCUG 7971]